MTSVLKRKIFKIFEIKGTRDIRDTGNSSYYRIRGHD